MSLYTLLRGLMPTVVGEMMPKGKPVIPVLRLQGLITSQRGGGGIGGAKALNPQALEPALAAAFKVPGPAVALVINSPGGSPACSSIMFKRIRDLSERNKKPVVAFVEDVAASGGYYLACAANEIFADASSIVGSIGVVSSTFGFQKTIEKLGVERRLFHHGERKAFLDPFSPLKEEDVTKLKQVQADIFETFVEAVRSSRGEKLKAKESEIFNGEFWTGKQALELGLIDGLGDVNSVMEERYGKDIRLLQVSVPPRTFLQSVFNVPNVSELGEAVVDAAVSTVEEREARSRFGL